MIPLFYSAVYIVYLNVTPYHGDDAANSPPYHLKTDITFHKVL